MISSTFANYWKLGGTMTSPLECMFDTVVFNRMLDGRLRAEDLEGKVIAFATHIQLDEIAKTPDPMRRKALMRVFRQSVDQTTPTTAFVLGVSRLDEAQLGGERMVPTASAVWGVSRWDQACWGSDDNVYSALKDELDQLNGGKANNDHDALIAETSIKRRMTLVTDDGDLATVTRKYGGRCLLVRELLVHAVGTSAT